MNRKSLVAVVLVMMCMFGFVMSGFSMFVGNYSEKSFTNPDGWTPTVNASEIVKDLLIKGATSFLRGQSNSDELVSKLEAAELEGLDYFELQTLVSKGLANMKAACHYYQELDGLARNLSYNPRVIEQLKAFDYLSQAREYEVNMDIFSEVKSYLCEGNIRGVYARFYTYTSTIVRMLETVQAEISAVGNPDTLNIWRLNQECAHMHLFGQYIAQIFRKIK